MAIPVSTRHPKGSMHSSLGFTFFKVDLLCYVSSSYASSECLLEMMRIHRNCNGRGSYICLIRLRIRPHKNACFSLQLKGIEVGCLEASDTVSYASSECLCELMLESTVVAIEGDQGWVSWGICHQRCPSLLTSPPSSSPATL